MSHRKTNQTPAYSFLLVAFLTMIALVGLFFLVDSGLNSQTNIASAQTAPTPEAPEERTPTNVGILPPGQTPVEPNQPVNPQTPQPNPQTQTPITQTPTNYNPGNQTVRSGGGEIALALIFITLSASSVYLYYIKDQKNQLKTTEKKIL